MVLSRGGDAVQGVVVLSRLCALFSGGGVLSVGGSDIITPLPCGQTETYENITLHQISFAGGKHIGYNKAFQSNANHLPSVGTGCYEKV